MNPYDPANANRAIPNPNKPFAMDASGNIVPNRAYQDYEIRKASAGAAARTNVNVDAGPKAFWSDFGKNATDVLLLNVRLRKPAASTVQSIAQIRVGGGAGAYQGAGADAKLAASKALGALGMPYDAKTVANTEFFNATANQFVLDKIKTLGANPSMLTASSSKRPFRVSEQIQRRCLSCWISWSGGRASRSANSTRKSNPLQGQQGAQFLPFSLEVPAPQSTSRAEPAKETDSVQSKFVDIGGRKVAAQRAPDGNFYVQQDGKFFRVKE